MHSICEQFGHILGGNYSLHDGLRSVEVKRSTLNVTILGRPTLSNHAVGAMFSFESLDQQEYALNLGETALLHDEAYPFTLALQQQGILVNSLHNHWLFVNPPLVFVRFSSIENPLSFARKVLYAFQQIVKPAI
ncbi:DUF1259 domain-containing protein [Bacillus sp. 165]|uniref:DUF1259 domain-containing protein n=1 Tax=Bacillus sp. 165 TaxID=1529117 RepID=UPI001FFE1189|nr:DUF1259 domain-containing protein [Bacillus sp. 165]